MSGQTILAPTNEKKSRFFYGYVIILASFLIVLISWGSQYSYGVFFKPVLNEFNWSRAVTSGAFSVNMILTGAFSILAGRISRPIWTPISSHNKRINCRHSIYINVKG